jgi:hypothetical protein
MLGHDATGATPIASTVADGANAAEGEYVADLQAPDAELVVIVEIDMLDLVALGTVQN